MAMGKEIRGPFSKIGGGSLQVEISLPLKQSQKKHFWGPRCTKNTTEGTVPRC